MNEEFEGVQRPIYRNLWVYWLMQLITLVLIPFNGVVFGIIGLAASIVQLYEVYAMREVSDGLARAWQWMILGIVLTFGGMILTLLALGLGPLAIVVLLVTLAGVIVMLVAEYYLYAGLDDLILPRGFDYPVGRIRWCFWLQLIGSFVSSAISNLSPWLGMLVQLIVMAVILWLLWQYLQAVKAREEA